MNKGIIGLRNRGNTCYLNTSIQCLSHLTLFTDYFKNNQYLEDLNTRCTQIGSISSNEVLLTQEYAKLMKALWESSTSIEPKTFHETLQLCDNRFCGYEQQDSQIVTP
jgi:ubiquitin C-terminal hydrolase